MWQYFVVCLGRGGAGRGPRNSEKVKKMIRKVRRRGKMGLGTGRSDHNKKDGVSPAWNTIVIEKIYIEEMS